MSPRGGKYAKIFEHVFAQNWRDGAEEVPLNRDQLITAARELDIDLPKNIGDVVYTFRYRSAMPESIAEKAPAGKIWIVVGRGDARYAWILVQDAPLVPQPHRLAVKVPDSTPGIVASHVMTSEQALLAQVRYNRLVDLFTGIVCYSLQNHLRTKIGGIGQVETDEVYLGVDKSGAQYVIPVEAKGGSDRLSIVQMNQDLALCKSKFPDLQPLLVGAQFLETDAYLFLFRENPSTGQCEVVDEARYRLVPPDAISDAELAEYQKTAQSGRPAR